MIAADTLRKARLTSLGMYALVVVLVLARWSRDESLPQAGIAMAVVAASGFLFALASHVRTTRHRPATVRGYYRDLQILWAHLTLAMLIGFALMLWPGDEYVVPPWYLPVVVAVAVHQYARGARLVVAKWRRAEDVLNTLQESGATARRFSAKYDFAFFVSLSIVNSLVSRFFGSGRVLLFAGLVGALCFPYLLGILISQRVVLARLLPDDMPLPRA